MTSSTSQFPPSVSRHFAGVTPNGPLMVSAVAVGLVILVVTIGMLGLMRSVFSGGIGDDEAKTRLDDLVARHTSSIDEYRQRFEKRYVFFKPPPPPPPPRVVRDEPPPPPPPPIDTGPKIPGVYQGPSIAWVIGEDVFFNMIVPTQTEKYFKVRKGEERNGVKVLSTEDLPRTVRVAHMGGEYDVKVFGETMEALSLFPVASTSSPRPSITIPGFVPSTTTDAASSPTEVTRALSEANGEEIEDDAGDGEEDDDGEDEPTEDDEEDFDEPHRREIPPQQAPSERETRRDRRGRGERPQRPDSAATSNLSAVTKAGPDLPASPSSSTMVISLAAESAG